MTLIIPSNYQLSVDLVEVLQKTIAYEQALLSANTRRAYSFRWKRLENWCLKHSLEALPAAAETISLFLGSLES